MKILKFKVFIEGLENKIWREIEISDDNTVANLAYVILASFDSLAYHLYQINHNGTDIYYCGENHDLERLSTDNFYNAIYTKLSDVDFTNPRMSMEYDFGSTTTFEIVLLDERETTEENSYMYIVDGAGHGMMDDEADFNLREIVFNTDKLGKSEYYYTLGYDRDYVYDYRDYNLNEDNESLGLKFIKIKKGYERLNEE